MYLDILKQASFYELLGRIDQDLAAQTQAQGCPHCGGPLHRAGYRRKPRGGPPDLPEALAIRHSLCCGRPGCRRRCLPPSVLYLGRRVYFGAVVLLATVLRDARYGGRSVARLCRLLGIGDRKTLRRWSAWFQALLPSSARWQRVRGVLGVAVRDDDLPCSLLGHLLARDGEASQAVQACLWLLSGPA